MRLIRTWLAGRRSETVLLVAWTWPWVLWRMRGKHLAVWAAGTLCRCPIRLETTYMGLIPALHAALPSQRPQK